MKRHTEHLDGMGWDGIGWNRNPEKPKDKRDTSAITASKLMYMQYCLQCLFNLLK
jgi:hypothetical protein